MHLEGLPHYWSPSSPLNYLIFYQSTPSESDFSVDDYFGALSAAAALPPTPSALFSSFQEEKARVLQLRNGGATRTDGHHGGGGGHDRSAAGGDSSGGEGSDSGGFAGGANDHQPLIVKPIEGHLMRLPVFVDLACAKTGVESGVESAVDSLCTPDRADTAAG